MGVKTRDAYNLPFAESKNYAESSCATYFKRTLKFDRLLICINMVSPCWSPQSLSITSNSHNNRGCFFGLKNPQSSCSLSSNKAASGSSLRAVNAVVCSNDVELAEPPALQCSGASGSASIEVAQVKMYSTNRQAVDRNGVMPERKVVPSFGFASFLRCGFELRSCRLHGESM